MTPGAAVCFLAGFCREHPLDEKVFVVPSFVAGRQIGETLARESGSFINLRFLTLPALAAEILERSGGPGAAAPMTASAELALADRLYRRLLDEERLGYFRGAGASPGLSLALHRALRDLRLDGRTSADLRPERFVVESKGRELALLLGLYERTLEEEGRLDLPALFARAIEASPKTRGSAWLLCPADRPFSRLECDLVRAAASGRLVLVPGDPVFGLERPRRCLPAPASAEPAAPGRMSWLFAPGKAQGAAKEPAVEIFKALGPANECREILRRLAAEKIPFDQAEVLAPAGSAHATAFFLFASRTGLPVSFGDGVPVSFTSPGRLFFGLAAWLAGDFLTDELCRLLDNGDLVLPGPVRGASLPARSACRYLRRAMIGWGRDRYGDRLEALVEGKKADIEALSVDDGEEDCDSAAGRAEGFLEAVAEIEALAEGVRRILDRIPRPDGQGKYDLRSLGGAFSELIGEFGSEAADYDRSARKALLDRLEEIAADSGPAGPSGLSRPMPLKEALDLLRAAGASLRIGASPPLPGRLHVASLLTGGLSGRPVTFVAGLDEASFPGRGLQDPVLLDEERAAISSSLPTSADILRSRLYGVASVLAALRGRVVLSFSSYDILDGREAFPSSVVLQAFRLVRGGPDLDYAALGEAIPQAAGFLPGGRERSFDEIEWWLDRLRSDPRPDGPRTVSANFPDLASGAAALEARAGEKLTSYDGIVDIGPLRADVDPVAGERAIMSPTRLELLAKCPFGYFLRHVLKVQPPEEVVFDRTRWLDPLQRGSLIHEILCDFMTEVADMGEEADAVRHAGLMDRIAGAAIAETRRKIPAPSPGIFESERRDILETLTIFMKAEARRENRGRPLEFEKAIEGERIDLGRGRGFRLRGFIDRVDEIAADTYRIIDYKTGSAAPYEDLVHFGRGRNLQPALYAVALEQMLARERPGRAPRVAESGYFFPSRRGEGHEIMVGAFDRDRLKELLNDLLRILEKGWFVAGRDGNCRYCDYAAACGSGGPECAAAKREASPEIFAAYDKLDEYK